MNCSAFAPGLLYLLIVLFTASIQCENLQKIVEKTTSLNDEFLQTIESYMDTEVDPCNDFYSYACGRWPAQHNNTAHYTEVTSYINYQVDRRLLAVLAVVEKPTGNEIYDKAWLYLHACQHQKQRSGLKYLTEVLPVGSVDWPLLATLPDRSIPQNSTNTTQSGRFDVLQTLALLRRYEVNNILFEHIVLPYAYNVSRSLIGLDRPSAPRFGLRPLPSRLFIAAMLTELGIGVQVALDASRQVLVFEQLLKQLQPTDPDEQGGIEESLEVVDALLKGYNWPGYIATVLGYNVSGEFVLQIRNFDYFKRLGELLQTTRVDVVANYIMLQALQQFYADGPSEFNAGQCMSDLVNKMALAMNYIYMDRFLRHDMAANAAEVQTVFERLRAELRYHITANAMKVSDKEREFMQAKLKHMEINMSANMTHDFVARQYANVSLSRTKYVSNHLALLHLRFQQMHAQLLANYERTANGDFLIPDSLGASRISIYFMLRRNRIVIPFGILQPPLFHRSTADIFKYSLLGYLLAHEMMHAFDAHGLAFNFEGNVQATGMHLTANEHYTAVRQCMSGQAKPTNFEETFADKVGLQLAYDAFFGPRADHVVQQLKFTQMTARRLFFLNVAQFFCGYPHQIFINHDEDRVRLQQMMFNLEAFGEEFNCSRGTVMNPEQKCRLW